ncbi:hypothetical protein [Streptomyces sp. NPDC086989]|uniref:hypothetical protein n=1 Tax=Streptomyces sp. NPDC086989 TaxID=3365764 RepID=UPI0037FB3F4B
MESQLPYQHHPRRDQGAIGAAKQLIEATAKTALRGLGVAVDKKPDVPVLVAILHKELRLDAASAPDGPDGSKAIKKILSGRSASPSEWPSSATRVSAAGTGRQARRPALVLAMPA